MVKNLPANAGDVRDVGSVWQPTPAFLPVKFHGQRNLLGYRPLGCKESDTADPRDTHILMSRSGECLTRITACKKKKKKRITASNSCREMLVAVSDRRIREGVCAE